MLRRQTIAAFVFLAALVVLPLLLPTQVHAQTTFEWTGVCVGGSAGSDGKQTVATIQGLECLIANALTVFIALIGLAAFVMIVIASFRLLISGGNTTSTEKARNTVTWAVIGIVVALSAFIILNLLSAFTGVDLTKFIIPRDTDTSDVPVSPSAGGTIP